MPYVFLAGGGNDFGDARLGQVASQGVHHLRQLDKVDKADNPRVNVLRRYESRGSRCLR